MAYTPVELTKDGKTVMTSTLEEEVERRFDGWLPTGSPPPDHSWDVVRVRDLGDAASPARVELKAAFDAGAAELMPLYVYGDSYNLSPGVNTTSGAEPQARVAKRLRLGTVSNYAVGGYDVAMTAQRMLSGNALDADGGAITRAGTWVPGSNGIVLIDVGKNNNLYTGGATAQTQAAIQHGLRTMLAVLASGTRVEDGDASIVYGGAGTAWASNADANTVSGGANHKTSTGTVGATVTITLPGPGTYWLFSSALDPAALSGLVASSFSVTLDGVAQTDWTVPQVKQGRSINSKICPTAYKVTATGTGTHTVVLTGKTGGTFTSFDFYAPAVTNPPLVVVRKQVKFRSYNGGGAWAWTGTGGGGGTDASLDALNGVIASVAAEFSHVVVSDATATWDNVSMIGADGLHPNDKGASCLADADEAAIRSAIASGFSLGLNR